MACILLILMFCITEVALRDTEPLCLSRYDYDHKVLRDIVTMETKLKDLQRKLDDQTDVIHQQERSIEQMQMSHKDSVRKLEQRIKDATIGSGSTYIRWGRSTCPENGTQIVYSGYAAGSSHTHSGAAANYLCLPSQPLWDAYEDTVYGGANVYGTEYEIFGTRSETFFKTSVGDHDAPCAVCRSVRTSSLMIPGRNACYDNWTLEYSGYLVADHYSHSAASEFVCLDREPEVIPGGAASLNGRLMYMAEAICGSLKCPPYVDGTELTCAVCTL